MHTTWRKSSYSSQEGDTCVELAELGTTIGIRDSTDPDGLIINLRRDGLAGLVHQIKTDGAWRKSSHSGGEGGQCVELAKLGTTIGVRDSVDPDGPVIHMRRDGFARFVHQIKTG